MGLGVASGRLTIVVLGTRVKPRMFGCVLGGGGTGGALEGPDWGYLVSGC